MFHDEKNKLASAEGKKKRKCGLFLVPENHNWLLSFRTQSKQARINVVDDSLRRLGPTCTAMLLRPEIFSSKFFPIGGQGRRKESVVCYIRSLRARMKMRQTKRERSRPNHSYPRIGRQRAQRWRMLYGGNLESATRDATTAKSPECRPCYP